MAERGAPLSLQQVRQRKPGVKKVVVEERRYDTLEDSSADLDKPKLPGTLPGNPSAGAPLPSEPMPSTEYAGAFADASISTGVAPDRFIGAYVSWQ